MIRQTRKLYSSLRFLVPLIAIFFGVFYWLEFFQFFIRDSEFRIFYFNPFAFLGFWFFTLCYLFKKFKSINFQSKILVLFVAFSISLEFYVLLMYTNFSDTSLHILYPADIFIIQLSSFMAILGVMGIVLGIVTPHFEVELNYLTNIVRIKNRETKTRYIFKETWASFPIFMGVNSIFFLLFGFININSSNVLPNVLPFIYMVRIGLPWIILMIFYIIYTSVVGLMKRLYFSKNNINFNKKI